MFGNGATGVLVPISGTDPRLGASSHRAFIPEPLPDESPQLTTRSHLVVADARAALAALDSTARRLPNPTLLRRPTLQREAQSTSALEGTYARLSDVLMADEEAPPTADLREILNYVAMADHAFAWVAGGREVSVTLLCELQARLVDGTPAEGQQSGDIRTSQVVIGQRPGVSPSDLPVVAARFVPPPPGEALRAQVADLVDWMRRDHARMIDPVVAAAMAHYQFETLHPFHDGNGRIGRLLVVLNLFSAGVLAEPTLTVSPWFETRRLEYCERLLAVSAGGDWDSWVSFFAAGIHESAETTHRQMLDLVRVQDELEEEIRSSRLRADTAHLVVDFAVGHPSFTVRRLERELGLSYGRANAVVGQLVDLGILAAVEGQTYNRRFSAPKVLDVLLGRRR